MSTEGLNALYTCCVLLALWIAWYKAVRPRWRRFWARVGAALDTLVGRNIVLDLASGTKLPAIQPLPERLGNIERAQERQSEVQKTQAETLAKVAEALERLGDHERRISMLESGQLEKAAIRFESGKLLEAVARRDEAIVDAPIKKEDPS